jgi:hypothetical protein
MLDNHELWRVVCSSPNSIPGHISSVRARARTRSHSHEHTLHALKVTDYSAEHSFLFGRPLVLISKRTEFRHFRSFPLAPPIAFWDSHLKCHHAGIDFNSSLQLLWILMLCNIGIRRRMFKNIEMCIFPICIICNEMYVFSRCIICKIACFVGRIVKYFQCQKLF